MPKKKKTATSGELVMVKSVHRTRSRRMKFCVHGGLGDSLNKQRRKPNGYPGALLAIYSIPHRKTVFVACSFDFGHKKDCSRHALKSPGFHIVRLLLCFFDFRYLSCRCGYTPYALIAHTV